MHVHDLGVNTRHVIIDISVHLPVVNIHGSGLNYKFHHLTLLAGCLPNAARPDSDKMWTTPRPGWAIRDNQRNARQIAVGKSLLTAETRRLTETDFPAPGLIPLQQREWMCHMSHQPQPQPNHTV